MLKIPVSEQYNLNIRAFGSCFARGIGKIDNLIFAERKFKITHFLPFYRKLQRHTVRKEHHTHAQPAIFGFKRKGIGNIAFNGKNAVFPHLFAVASKQGVENNIVAGVGAALIRRFACFLRACIAGKQSKG
ncbi:MAG: hypothetical protein WCR95_04925 [Eubacteriales bacterium]